MKNRRGGFTLVEVAVAGTVLTVLTLVAAQGFLICNKLINRSSRFQKQEQELKLHAAREEMPEDSRKVNLSAASLGQWSVIIDTYEMDDGKVKVSLKALRVLPDEK